MKIRLAVLGSGAGTNLNALIAENKKKSYNFDFRIVISDRQFAKILDVARKNKIPSYWVDFRTIEGETSNAKAQEKINAILLKAKVDLVILAGFMRIIREPILTTFANRILNIHPSLLPKFRGLNACAQALDSGEKFTGTTVHLVDAGIDTGKILEQKKLQIYPDDTSETLHERIKYVEHKLFAKTIHHYYNFATKKY